jgi:WS/DGAT/MGAT family acyltransferase
MTGSDQMLHSDAFAWYMEKDPVLRSTIVAVIRLDGPPEWELLRKKIDRLTHLVPRLRMRVQPRPLRLGPPRWTVDDDFDLDYHLRRQRVGGSGDWAEVLEFARRAAMSDLDRARPLWEFTLLEGLDGGGAAFVTKLHHSLTDGIGGMHLAALVVDFGPVPTERAGLPEAPPAQPRRGVDLAVLLNPAELLRRTVGTVRSVARFVAPVNRQYSTTLGERSISRSVTTLDVPLAGLHDAAAAAGTHVNDAFLAALVDGMRRYHLARGADLTRVRVTVPVSIRTAEHDIGGNRITLTRITLPADIDSPAARMQAVQDVMAKWRHEPALALTQQIAFGLNLVPRAYLNGVLKRVEMLASDVPGVPIPMWLAGARVTGYYAFGPTIGAAVNATLMSYAGMCNIGINIDTRAIDNPKLWVQCVVEAFDDLLREVPAG